MASDDGLSGVKTATQLILLEQKTAAGDTENEEDEAPELDLLGLPRLKAGQRANLTRAGRGRPPGARNHSTEAWREHITRRYGSPLEVLAQMSRAPVEELARELHCSRLDAFVQKRHAAEALAGYIHPKLTAVSLRPSPTTLQIKGELAYLVDLDPGKAVVDVTPASEPASEDVVAAETVEAGENVAAVVTDALEALLALAADPVAGPLIRRKPRGAQVVIKALIWDRGQFEIAVGAGDKAAKASTTTSPNGLRARSIR